MEKLYRKIHCHFSSMQPLDAIIIAGYQHSLNLLLYCPFYCCRHFYEVCVLVSWSDLNHFRFLLFVYICWVSGNLVIKREESSYFHNNLCISKAIYIFIRFFFSLFWCLKLTRWKVPVVLVSKQTTYEAIWHSQM